MEKKDIKLVLTSPYKDILDYSLNMVNLSEKELNAITYVDIQGKSEERASEKMNMSLSNIQKLRAKAYDKLGKVWGNSTFIKVFIEMNNKK